MNFDKIDYSNKGLRPLYDIPNGSESLLINKLISKKSIIYIFSNQESLESFKLLIKKINPKIEVYIFPAWDCLPFDRISPNSIIQNLRVSCLNSLSHLTDDDNILLLTTINAVTQRVLAKNSFRDNIFNLKAGEHLDLKKISNYLLSNGYTRVGLVREQGEYSIRGGIIDIYASNNNKPIRLDLFGEKIENIRIFDPLTQISTKKIESLFLSPFLEIPFDKLGIKKFKENYKRLYGSVIKDDPMYDSIIEQTRYSGMEHWLPLFANNLETIFDYLPKAIITISKITKDVLLNRFKEINENYINRLESIESFNEKNQYRKPLSPEKMYLTDTELKKIISSRFGFELFPFKTDNNLEKKLSFGCINSKDFTIERNDNNLDLISEVKKYIKKTISKNNKVIFVVNSQESFKKVSTLFDSRDIKFIYLSNILEVTNYNTNNIFVINLPLRNGFKYKNTLFITEVDIFGNNFSTKKNKNKTNQSTNFISELSSLRSNDIVVHIDHGIGQYKGLINLNIEGASHDCLMINYLDNDKLYLPVENIELLSKYGSDSSSINLDKLGGIAWQKRKSKLKKRIKDLADQLIKTAAIRKNKVSDKFIVDNAIYNDFASQFPFELTGDQQETIDHVYNDLSLGKPMDRLICGDVGFGKTEIAIQASFAIVMNGGQVAIIVPTTLLARQHYETFQSRFSNYNIKIEMLSRLIKNKKRKDILSYLEKGSVDIIIGTHSLISNEIQFDNLGLLIIDEEQHFGVKHKEKLKLLKKDVHVLTMTATPIPRTMQMAMTGLRDLSLIATPPIDRLAVRTFIMNFDNITIKEALIREEIRGGQSFIVCPRIKDLFEVEKFIHLFLPNLTYAIAHGKVSPDELEKIMEEFYDNKINILISTNIIESGLDIPNANTMIVYKADKFGLSQLYQLRGRIGRSKKRAYAYLTTLSNKKITDRAIKRLEVMQTLDQLGAGFTLASHDLDIRGAGNLLGEEQSGHIKEVGFELYQQLLEEFISKQTNKSSNKTEDFWSPQINLGLSVSIPENFVSDLDLRLSLYRRLGRLNKIEEVEKFSLELVDRFGTLPEDLINLIEVVKIKTSCRKVFIERIDSGPNGAIIKFRNNYFPNPDKLINLINGNRNIFQLRSDHKLIYKKKWIQTLDRINGVKNLINKLQEMI